MSRYLLPAAFGLLALAGCTAEEMNAAIEDPGGFACRERLVGNAGVDFNETTATPINRDIFGIANYDVTAAGVTYRCVVDADNDVITIEPV